MPRPAAVKAISYLDASKSLTAALSPNYLETCSGLKKILKDWLCDSYKLWKKRTHYQYSDEFRAEALARFLSPETRSSYETEKELMATRVQAFREANGGVPARATHRRYPLEGGLVALIGFSLAYWRAKRRFDRTNEYGVEVHQSFLRLVLERLVNFVVITVAVIMMFLGLWAALPGVTIRF